MVNDNFHYMDENERWELGSFAEAKEAISACCRLVDDDLSQYHNNNPQVNALELYKLYTMFGDDPFIVSPPGLPAIDFSAWSYAKRRAEEICSGPNV